MARKQNTKKKIGIKQSLITTVLVLLVLYIGIHIVSRTDGVCSALADKISNATRQPVALESCGATPLLGLQLKGLTFQGVEMPDVKIAFNWFFYLTKDKPFVKQLRIKELNIQFKRAAATGNWEPLVLHGIGSRLGAVLGLNPTTMDESDALPKFPDYAINGKTLLLLSHAKVVWRDEKGREIAYITDADINVKAAIFIKRKVIQTIVKCGNIKLASGRALRDFRLEAFRIEGSSVITVLDMTDSNGAYDEFASQTLWQDLNLRLSQLSEM